MNAPCMPASSTVFAGHEVGVKQLSDQVWLVSFMHYDLGFFDNESCRVEAAENPFGATRPKTGSMLSARRPWPRRRQPTTMRVQPVTTTYRPPFLTYADHRNAP